MLEVYHLERSQSERVVWLCEELNIPYELHVNERNPETALAPPIFKELHTPGSAPVIVDTTPDGRRVVLGESGACVEYIINVHGGGRLKVDPSSSNYADYVYWLHFANGSFQPSSLRLLLINTALSGGPTDNPILGMMRKRHASYLDMLDERLRSVSFLAGDELTAADIMLVVTLTTIRGFDGIDLTGRDNILRYLQRIAGRDAYKQARQKGDPKDPPLITPKVEKFKYGALK